MKTGIFPAFLATAFILFSASAFAQENEKTPPAPEDQVVVYYFHGTTRCGPCRTIESYTREAIKTGFSEERENKELVWKPLNIERKKNRHFVRHYGLYSKSVVLSKREGGEETDWKNLTRVWHLLRNKQGFIDYVQAGIREMMGEQSK